MSDMPPPLYVSFDRYLDLRDKFLEERDKRYSELQTEREKAVRIKEVADQNALVLAREIQAWRDAGHNDLLRQWQADRGRFVSTEIFEAAVNPLTRDLQARGTRGTALSAGWAYVIAALMALIALVSTGISVAMALRK